MQDSGHQSDSEEMSNTVARVVTEMRQGGMPTGEVEG
jgi:hypothetical protein